MEIVNRRLTVSEFKAYIASYDFGPQPPDKLVIHHTWRPTKDSWQGGRTIMGLKRYYEGKGWTAGPHLFIAHDGIWLFSPMRHNGIHAGELNNRSIGIEVVGDYDEEKWSGETKKNTLAAIKLLQAQLGIDEPQIFFHRDASSKSCPGHAITKEWLFAELRNFRLKPRIPGSNLRETAERLSAPLPTGGTGAGSTGNGNTVFVTVPEWAEAAVRFVQQHNLFQIRNEDDIRDAVKFHRFYQLIQSEYDDE